MKKKKEEEKKKKKKETKQTAPKFKRRFFFVPLLPQQGDAIVDAQEKPDAKHEQQKHVPVRRRMGQKGG